MAKFVLSPGDDSGGTNVKFTARGNFSVPTLRNYFSIARTMPHIEVLNNNIVKILQKIKYCISKEGLNATSPTSGVN